VAAPAAAVAARSEMERAHPEFVPDPELSRAEMEELQTELASHATFVDDLPFDPATVSVREDETLAGAAAGGDDDRPVVVGVDQAFLDDRAVSAVVALRGGEVIERVHAVEPLSIPYVPGLLSFREGNPILAALDELTVDPDLAVFDGSGRIHYREAGLATHIGVVLDLPSVGVAKNLLCGTPEYPADGLPQGARVAIEADEDVTAPEGETIGYAVQSRQYAAENRHVNPLYVSPGHRVSAETAADLALACCAGYKLPEPTRLADVHADEAKAEVDGE